MTEIKTFLGKILRKPLVKWLTRGALWLLVSVLGADAAAADSQAAAIAEWGATGLIAAIAFAIDLIHHKKDIAEQPK